MPADPSAPLRISDVFADRSILVTGASSGLGAAAVRRFAAGGGSVYAAARDQARLAEVAASCADLPGQVVVGPLDVASPSDCRTAVAAAVDVFGGLDVLVNNAGRHDFRITTDVSEQEWASPPELWRTPTPSGPLSHP